MMSLWEGNKERFVILVEQEGSVSILLSHSELLYLGAFTSATEIYGIMSRESSGTKEHNTKEYITKEWEEVKKRLTEKDLIQKEEDTLSMKPTVEDIINVICNPKIFIVCTKRDNEGKESVNNFYFSQKRAVRMVKDAMPSNDYVLTQFTDSKALSECFQDFFQVSNKEFVYEDKQVELTTKELKEFIEAVMAENIDKQVSLLTQKGFEDKFVFDVGDALKKKDDMCTMLVVSLDKQAGRVLKEFLIYSGKKYLWQIEVHGDSTKILITNRDIYTKKMEIISELFDYYV